MPDFPPRGEVQNQAPRSLAGSYPPLLGSSVGRGGGLREDDPSDDGDDEEDREELDRRGRHARPPRPPDPRQAARIRGDARAGMELRGPGRRDREP
jgi:hypothetical protein